MKNKRIRYLSVMLCVVFLFTVIANTDYASAHSKRHGHHHNRQNQRTTWVGNTSGESSSSEVIKVDEAIEAAKPIDIIEATNEAITEKIDEVVVETLPEVVVKTTEGAIVVTEPAVIAEGSYYVSKDGSDSNTGTSESPWKTIQKAADTAVAGDIVYIKEGTYNERVVLQNSGIENGYITFANYPGETVTIDGTGQDWGYNWNCLFDINQQDYIKVDGLNIINSMWAGIGDESDSDGCQHVILQNCSTNNTKASGIAFYNCGDITLDNVTVEQACMGYLEGTGCQESISLSDVDTFVVKNSTVLNITNNIEGLGGEGIDAKEGCSDGKIFNNTVHDVAKMGIYLDSYSKTEDNIEVYNNSIYDCGAGIVAAAEKGGLLSNANIHDNTIKNCSDGIIISDWGHAEYSHPMDTITIENNTLEGISSRAIAVINSEATNVVITNNTGA